MKTSKIPKGLILKPKSLTREEAAKLVESWEEVNKGFYNPESSLVEPYSPAVKPIFTIGLPIAQIADKESFNEFSRRLEEKLSDYHVLVYSQVNSLDVVFQAFYEKDFKEDEFEKLKQDILDSLK